MSDIKFNCPKCQRPMVADEQVRFHTLICPDCHHLFFPIAKDLPKTAPFMPPPPSAARLLDVQKQSAGLHHLAGILSRVGLGAAALGMLVCFLAVIGGDERTAVISAGSGLGAGAFLYLVAQLIHIRASVLNLEK